MWLLATILDRKTEHHRIKFNCTDLRYLILTVTRHHLPRLYCTSTVPKCAEQNNGHDFCAAIQRCLFFFFKCD